MTLSEKIYTLRKQHTLSQEQLAEVLGVSRQAVSKWETGQSVPDTDKLIAISEQFRISLDNLLKDDTLPQPAPEQPECTVPPENPPQPKPIDTAAAHIGRILGLIFCIGGALALLIHTVLFFFFPAAYQRSGGSSMIMLDGNAICMLLGAAAIILGAVLFVRASKP